MFREFKPSLFFLLRFLAVYFAGNVLYGIYVESFGERPDRVTHLVTRQTSRLLNWFGYPTSVEDNAVLPTVLIRENGENVLSVYEGCNGINVMVVFVAFLVAYGGPLKRMAWFIPVGLAVIHIANLFRIGLLYFVSNHYEAYFFFIHKYLFTAIIYVVVFGLWVVWVRGVRSGNA